MSVNLELEGVDSVIAKLEAMGKKANQAINEALEAGADPILKEAKSSTQWKDRSGRLRKSLMISKVKTSKRGKVIWVGDVERKAPYSWYIEYGHSKGSAKPFLRPAYMKKKQESKQLIMQTLSEAIKNES